MRYIHFMSSVLVVRYMVGEHAHSIFVLVLTNWPVKYSKDSQIVSSYVEGFTIWMVFCLYGYLENRIMPLPHLLRSWIVFMFIQPRVAIFLLWGQFWCFYGDVLKMVDKEKYGSKRSYFIHNFLVFCPLEMADFHNFQKILLFKVVVYL